MLVIRRTQMAALSSIYDARLGEEIMVHLRALHPQVVVGLTAQELRARVDASLSLGRRYSLEGCRSLAAFVVLRFTMAPGFHLQSKLQGILSDVTSPSDIRIRRLSDQTTPDDWRAALAAEGAFSW